MTHTATPWTWGIAKQTKQIIIAHECHCEGLCPDFGGMVLIEGECLGADDAQRIVDCVNALAGIRPEAVREMREACEMILRASGSGFGGYCPNLEKAQELASAALKAVKE